MEGGSGSVFKSPHEMRRRDLWKLIFRWSQGQKGSWEAQCRKVVKKRMSKGKRWRDEQCRRKGEAERGRYGED